MSKVVILGAGVSGLTSALCLLQTYPGQIKDLSILSSEWPGDYHAHDFTSPWAGANWASFAQQHETDQITRDKDAYIKFGQLSKTEPESGVKSFPLKMFLLKSHPDPWYVEQNFVEELKVVSDEELRYRNMDPALYKGFEFKNFTVTPNVYNNYLISKIVKLGGKVKRVPRLDTITDIVKVVGHVPDLVVNATGVNAGKLLRKVDPSEVNKVVPIKGQILQIYEDLPYQVMVETLPKELKGKPNQFLNIFPRAEGGCIVGGIFNKGDWSSTVEEDLSKSILAVCRNHVPELKSTTVYNSYVALRPGREGGVRIELSEYPIDGTSRTLRVVHNYGIGGAGYQSSYGSAAELCSKVAKVIASAKTSKL
ncbi:DAO domain-containing protein [Lachancea thermotolerans]|uniref:KLTH0H13090p n=1 Tax=Lachancea thermotolerans (strain ATCC 56472 / CBS 6340 / NRRL Y-8284) TaxID=559295 RepID=C5E3F9_LACTC|nr:KLTH0H13090p [Lachancea thermotolerans CBS 6340]CAR30570.1 KLTH0H13090p [Lachancea thermotolerans CBS 6340]